MLLPHILLIEPLPTQNNVYFISVERKAACSYEVFHDFWEHFLLKKCTEADKCYVFAINCILIRSSDTCSV